MKRHPWAIGLMDSRRTPGPETLRHHDAVLGCLRAAGFSLALTGHAAALLDAHLYGFVVQELALPFQAEGELAEIGAEILGALPEAELPHFQEFALDHALQPGTPSATSSSGASSCCSTVSPPTWPTPSRRVDDTPRLRRRRRPERRPRTRSCCRTPRRSAGCSPRPAWSW